MTGTALVAAFALQLGGGSSAGSPGSEVKESRAAGQPAEEPPAPTPLEERLAVALREGVERAGRLGGQVEAATMLDGSAAPIVASSEPGGAARSMRMWSISKVATMVALLRLLGWGESAGKQPRPEVVSALEGALIRSENCRQRRVVLELQRAAGGISAARSAFAEVFSRAGAKVIPGSQVEAPESLCIAFLEEQTEIPGPLAPALLLGTSRWRVADAARLAHALAVRLYGRAISIFTLGLMRPAKLPSRESEPGELTAPPDWGAGSVFFGLSPAYKAGWGGSLNGDFMAGQIAVVPLGGGDHLALAVMFHTDAQPSRDDPGITTAPEAVEAVMEAVRASVLRSDGPRRAAVPSSGFTGDD